MIVARGLRLEVHLVVKEVHFVEEVEPCSWELDGGGVAFVGGVDLSVAGLESRMFCVVDSRSD